MQFGGNGFVAGRPVLDRIRGCTHARSSIPDVVIGGAPRCGTTFLCELLAKHPGAYVARPFVPEPKVCLTAEHDDGVLEAYATYFGDAPPGKVKVEKTSNYFENETARGRLVRLLPEAKFIFMLREPIARAYSNWAWSRKNGLECLSFADAIDREGHRLSPLPANQEYARPFDYMRRGRYGSLAEAWIRAIGRERIGFFVLESSLAAPQRFVDELQCFIGLDPLKWEKLMTGRINTAEPDPAGLDPGLAAELRRRIAPEIQYLAQVSGLDLSIWGY
jgi:hypothetical protein